MKAIWDEKTQEFHGGQDWTLCADFKEDFSVTTNGLGTPRPALLAAQKSLDTIHHYPPADQEPALSSLASFLWPPSAECDADFKDLLILGNGASELIDLVVRSAPPGPFQPGPSTVQYMEYQRSASAHGRTILPPPLSQSQVALTTPISTSTSTSTSKDTTTPAIISLVNPTNPTGDYLPIEHIKAWISSNVKPGTVVTIDESMQPWLGPSWRTDSLISQRKWINTQLVEHGIQIYIIHSWTKIWSCTGLRLGSIICPSPSHKLKLKSIQVPWSVNTPALSFLHEVVKDDSYLSQTWELTPIWHRHTRTALEELSKELHMEWEIACFEALSWVWIDMKSEKVAERAVLLASLAGVPVRWGKPGYGMCSFVRMAIREPSLTQLVIDAWKHLGDE